MRNTSLTTAEAATVSRSNYVELKRASATKLGKHADGGIRYQISCDPGRSTLFVTITDNSSGGYFSNEYVPLDRVWEILNRLDQPTLPSSALKEAFTGKSSNNAGFLAAILHAEGLLARAPDTEAKHVLAGDWNAWKVALLALEGSPAKPNALVAQSADAQMTAEKHNTLTLKRIRATDRAG